MGLKAVIVESDREDRELLSRIVSGLGHQARECSAEHFCRAYREQLESCPEPAACADVQLMETRPDDDLNSLDFVAWQRDKNCKISPGHIAVIAADWSQPSVRKADQLGVRRFTKPFLVKELVDWMYEIKKVKRKQ